MYIIYICLLFRSPTIKRWASASKLQRQHNLFHKSVVKPETCSPCGKKIRFGSRAYKCKGLFLKLVFALICIAYMLIFFLSLLLSVKKYCSIAVSEFHLIETELSVLTSMF